MYLTVRASKLATALSRAADTSADHARPPPRSSRPPKPTRKRSLPLRASVCTFELLLQAQPSEIVAMCCKHTNERPALRAELALGSSVLAWSVNSKSDKWPKRRWARSLRCIFLRAHRHKLVPETLAR